MNYINSQWQESIGARFQSHNPATKALLWEGNHAGHPEVEEAAAAAKAGFAAWSREPVQERIKFLKKFREELKAESDTFARLISSETGKPVWEAQTELAAAIAKLDISITAQAERCPEKDSLLSLHTSSITRFRPIGPMAVFGPFNLPLHLPNGHIIPALLAGNSVVFKPSELTPLCGQKMIEVWDRVGLPAGTINLLQGGKSTGQSIVENSTFKGILFTGSYRTGKAIHRALAGQPERLLALEMGGNNPLIAWEVTDPQAAAYHIIQSAFITSGQRCVCARRLILPTGQEGDELIEALVRQTEQLTVGLPLDEPEPFMGPLISPQAARDALAAQHRLLADGAQIILELSPSPRSDALLSPGIVDVTSVPKLPDEEVFAPLLQVIRAENFNQAIQLAEKTSFGLSAGLLSDSESLYKRYLEQCSAGILNWNRQTTGAVSSAPFGGTGKSGNYRPSAFLAADYCSYPVASIECNLLTIPDATPPGLNLNPAIP